MFTDNPDFYPTPKSLMTKMLSKIDFRTIQTVLEPSAGRGDLVEAITEKFKYHQGRNKNYDIDTIEIDENLQHVIKGKGFRLVHNDFLSYQTFKRYNAIIANFPFSNGEHHLKKAIEMQEENGGHLICLVNAETLRNPFTNTRKEIKQKLEENNASVEYIENAFSNSERSTSVTVALIHMSISRNSYNSVVLESLKQEEKLKSETEYNSKDLIDSDFIKGIVQQYNYEIKAGLKLINEYNSLKPLMLANFNDNSNPILKLDLEYKDNESTLDNGYIKQIRSKYWKTLFNNNQFMGLFTTNLKRQYMQRVDELSNYDFSLYNIYSLRLELSKDMTKGVEETIISLFDEFSHKHYYEESSKNIHLYNGWKTNKAYKINKKVIIPLNGFTDISYSWGRYRPTNYNVLDKLKDIEKVFNYLDGGMTEDLDIEHTLIMAEHYQETRKIELKYFYVSFYKKGTCHIEFKDMELLKKFNLFGTQNKGWLPPSYGKAEYNNMTQEEKEVINNFEGIESYESVLKNKSYFLFDTEEILKLIS
ncbi:DUF4942 domain-containing protein [Cytobacillus kochii]|uniref:DUF4942 domain-containing protein n=1 Tax=Cytobacillus kochii TaxID=859143 RepID=UPI001CD76BC5|nr:DUF4942 domain-containing protein [Cytobacillus kochii]MCA1025713.1 DUF4942 domain-containing protein [Cytobacillus kochii]